MFEAEYKGFAISTIQGLTTATMSFPGQFSPFIQLKDNDLVRLLKSVDDFPEVTITDLKYVVTKDNIGTVSVAVGKFERREGNKVETGLMLASHPSYFYNHILNGDQNEPFVCYLYTGHYKEVNPSDAERFFDEVFMLVDNMTEAQIELDEAKKVVSEKEAKLREISSRPRGIATGLYYRKK